MKSTTLTLEAPSQPQSAYTTTFRLRRNSTHLGAIRLLYGIGIFLIPTLLAHAIFASTFRLLGADLVIATTTTGLILFNLVLFLLNRAKKGDRTLIFTFNNLRIIENTEAVQIIPFEDLKITLLTYGMGEDEHLPAIRIAAENFGCMTIGSTQHSEQWQANTEQIDCTTYLIASEEEWERLMEIINQFK